MDTIKYKRPDDIPVHFLGETLVSTKRLQTERRKLQCLSYIIFHMIDNAENTVGKYAVCAVRQSPHRGGM